MPATVRLMVLPPGVALACWMAERSVTVPAAGLRTSARLLTLKTAGTQRSSSNSKVGRASAAWVEGLRGSAGAGGANTVEEPRQQIHDLASGQGTRADTQQHGVRPRTDGVSPTGDRQPRQMRERQRTVPGHRLGGTEQSESSGLPALEKLVTRPGRSRLEGVRNEQRKVDTGFRNISEKAPLGGIRELSGRRCPVSPAKGVSPMDDTPSSQTSPTLLGRLRQQPSDQAAWEQFVERYGRLILAWCRQARLQDADIEDVTQIVLIKLADKMRTFAYDPVEKFSRLAEDADPPRLERLRRVAAARRQGDRRQRGGGTLAHAAGPRRPGGAPGGAVRP